MHQHTSASRQYTTHIRQHTSTYVSIRMRLTSRTCGRTGIVRDIEGTFDRSRIDTGTAPRSNREQHCCGVVPDDAK